MGKTLAEKIWEQHVVHSADGEPDLLYIDLHLLHEVTSPQAFDGLRAAGLATRRGVPVKILGKGELTKPLTVHAHKFSKSARAAIESAGGVCQVLE